MMAEVEHGGRMLAQLRHAAGLTQVALAELAALHVRTIRGLESGKVVRPRRTSIELLARALSLDVGARLELLAAWGLYDDAAQPPAEVPGTARLEKIESLLAGSRRSVAVVALTETTTIDESRRTVSRSTEEVVMALADEVSSRYVFYDPIDEQLDLAQFHLLDLQNCTIRREFAESGGTAKIFELELAQGLQRGETQIVRYRADFRSAWRPGNAPRVDAGEAVSGFLRSPSSFVAEVRFHEDALPASCQQVFQARPTGPVQVVRELTLTSDHAVHIVLTSPKPGGHGIAWRWQ